MLFFNLMTSLINLLPYDCNTKYPISLQLSTDAFFQTNNFPKPYHGDLNECNITFTFDDPGKKVQLIVIKTEYFFDENNYLFYNHTSYDTYFTPTYSFKDHYTKKSNISYAYLAVIEYIAFEPTSVSRCVFETKDPIFLFTELEVMFVQSDFDFINIPSSSCHWKFSTFKEYGFKVVIQNFEPELITSLDIRNSTDTFVNYRSAKTFHAYYNSDNYLQIDVFKSKNQSTLAFRAYITPVKKVAKVKHDCKAYSNSNGDIKWYIKDTLKAFNSYCSYDFVISNKNVEYDVTVEQMSIERNVDFLKYTYEENGQKIIRYADGNPDIYGDYTWFTLFGYSNGSQRQYQWEVETDGSIPSSGTDLVFKKIKCSCIGKTIPCTSNAFTGIMNQYNYRYCGNLRCNFTMEPCLTNKYISDVTIMQISIRRERYDLSKEVDGNMDVFTVYSNGMIVMHLEINTFNMDKNDYVLFLNNSNENVFEVTTFPSRLSKTLRLQTNQTIIPPVVQNVFLTSAIPYAIIDTGLYRLNTVKVQNHKKDDEIVIYSNTGYRIPIFEDESLSVSYNGRTCFGTYKPNVCKIKNDKFAIYVPDLEVPFPMLLITPSNYFEKGCVFKQNIFITKEIAHLPITVIANSENNCMASILVSFNIQSPEYYYISSYWTSSRTENVQVFAGTDNLYFEFNQSVKKIPCGSFVNVKNTDTEMSKEIILYVNFSSKASNKFTRIELFSHFYTIKVPKNSAVYLQLEQVVIYNNFNPEKNTIINILQNNYSSLISTAFYGTSKGNWGLWQVYICFQFRKIKLTTIYFKNGGKDNFYINFKDNTTYVKQNGESFIFDNTVNYNVFTPLKECVDWFYLSNDISPENGIIFLVETVDDKI